MDLNLEKKFDISSIKFPYKISLKEAITVDNKEVKEISLRTPKGHDYSKHISTKDERVRNVELACDLSGLSEEDFGQLHFIDHAKALEVAEGFFFHYHPLDNGMISSLLNSQLFADGLDKIADARGSGS